MNGMRPRSGRSLAIAACAMALAVEALAIDPGDINNEVDYVIVTHPTFAAQAERLAAHRTAYSGLRTGVVTTTAIHQAFAANASDISDSEAGLVPNDMTDVELRAFVIAMSTWKIRPAYLVLLGDANVEIPGEDYLTSHYITNPNEPTHVFPSDAWCVARAPTAQGGNWFPHMRVGRIPAKTLQEAANYVDKVITYDGYASSTPYWADSILGYVGNCASPSILHTFNSLWDAYVAPYSSTWKTVRRADEDYDCNSTVSTLDARSDWAFGYGFLQAFGNTASGLNFVQLVDVLAWQTPACNVTSFTAGLDSGANGKWPFILAASCWPGAYEKHYVCPTNSTIAMSSSIPEDLLCTTSLKGAIGIATTSAVTGDAEGVALDRAGLEGFFKEDIRETGQLTARAIRGQLAVGPSWSGSAKFHLFGDPAVKLVSSKQGGAHWRTGMEPWDDFVWQNKVLSESVLSQRATKVTSNATSPYGPGIFEMNAYVFDAFDGQASHVEWLVDDVNTVVASSANLMLTFAMKVMPGSDATAGSRITLDGMTTVGPLRAPSTSWPIMDQWGHALSSADRAIMPVGSYARFYVDLSPLYAHTLQTVTIRYAGIASQGGVGNVVFDDIGLLQANPSNHSDEIVNGGFETDRDSPGLPDYWTPLAAGTEGIVEELYDYAEGKRSVSIVDEGTGQGLQQLVYTTPSVPVMEARIKAMSFSACPARITVKDAVSGAVVQEAIHVTGTTWGTYRVIFANPSYWGGSARVSLSLRPNRTNETLFIDVCEMVPHNVSVAETESAIGVPDARVFPMPGRIGDVVTFEIYRPGSDAIRGEVFDVAGRRVAQLGNAQETGGWQTLKWDSGRERSGLSRLGAGVYFARFFSGEAALGSARSVLIEGK